MQLRAEIQIATMIKAMREVVIPALDAKNDLAVQQAQLIVSMLNLMAHQLPIQFLFDRDELQRLIACARGLATVRSDDVAIGAAWARLDEDCERAVSVLERCATDPAELTNAVRDLRAAVAALAAAASGQDAATLRAIEDAVLQLSREQLLRDRSLMLSQGWELDPAAIPDIGTLLNAGKEI